MTVEDIREGKMIIFEGIVGSQAYGTATPESDIDIKGVYIQPMDSILGFGYVEQVSDKTNDTVYYEVRRFLQLLSSNNPNILELLNLPEDKILYKDELFDIILQVKHKFISKAAKNSFAGYAIAQIKKARGLNKKIVNPMSKEKKSPLDFCYIIDDNGSTTFNSYLESTMTRQSSYGLVNIPNARDIYALYYAGAENPNNYSGIVKEVDGKIVSNDIRLSSVPKGETPISYLSYNKDGYIRYCKDYKEYWDWIEKRNDSRYNEISEHGKNYDGKNMMHCYRLLSMSLEIVEGKGINVARPDREHLLSIRRGEYDYDMLVNDAEKLIKEIDEKYKTCNLPDKIDINFVNDLLLELRWSHHNNCERTAYSQKPLNKILNK